MITERFHIVLIVAVLIYLAVILKMLKERVTLLKYTLLWLLTGIVLLAFALFPNILKTLAGIFGIHSDVNFLFLALIGFLLMISFSLTHIVSRLNEHSKRLTQEISIMGERIGTLEKHIKKDDIT